MPRRYLRQRERCDDAKDRMRLTERRLAGAIAGIPTCRHQARRLGRVGSHGTLPNNGRVIADDAERIATA